jgi:hypothetical protein
MKINIYQKINPEKDDIVIATVDSTYIRVTNREENGCSTNGGGNKREDK